MNSNLNEVPVVDEDDIPCREICQNRVEEFASITGTDEALAQFFLQDHKWNLELSVNAFYEARSAGGGGNASSESDPDLLVTFDSSLGSVISKLGTVTTEPPHKFKLMSWNVDGLDDHNLKKRTKAVAKIIETEKPDIVFLQEVLPVTYSYLEEHLPHYMFIAGGAEDYFSATLLFRTTVYFDGHVLISFPNSSMGRNLLVVDCHIGSLKLRLLNTHLESTADFTLERKSQLRRCFELLKAGTKEHTSIFGGDLNLRDKEVNEVQMPTGVYDLWESCGRRKECQYTWDTLRNTNKSFPGKFKPRLRFDRIYLNQSEPPSVQPVHFGLVGIQKVSGTQSFPSDHWGIITQFKILNQKAISSSPPPSYVQAKSTHLPLPTTSTASRFNNSSTTTIKNIRTPSSDIEEVDDGNEASKLSSELSSASAIKDNDDSVLEIEIEPPVRERCHSVIELD